MRYFVLAFLVFSLVLNEIDTAKMIKQMFGFPERGQEMSAIRQSLPEVLQSNIK